MTPGAIQPGNGADATSAGPASREDPAREDLGRDAFASFMDETPTEKAAPAEGTLPAPISADIQIPQAFFWPTSPAAPALLADASALVPAAGQLVPVEPQLDVVPVPPPVPSAVVSVPSPSGQPLVVADQRVAAGMALPPGMTPVPPEPVDPKLAPPAQVVEGAPTAVSRADTPLPAAAPSVMAASGLRFWQATLQALPETAPAPEPQMEPDSLPPLPALAAGDRPAAAPGPAPVAASPTSLLVAKLAETALQSLFAAQSEQAAQEPEDTGNLGLSPLTQTAVPGAVTLAVVQASTLPTLAAQLVQTLAQRPDGTTEIALSPDELGHVRVTLQADAQNPDRIIVMLNFERPETLDLFRRHADQLADALRDAGFSGADIGFGRSDGGENRDSPSDTPVGRHATDTGLADLPAGPAQPHPALRLAATGTLDLRL